MGTSDAYGGTDRRPWNAVRQRFDQVPIDDRDEGGEDNGGDSDDDSPSDALVDFGTALANALALDDIPRPPSGFTLSDLLPRSTGGGGGGGGAGAGVIRGESGGSGRTGRGSRRSVARSAARGGAALGGAYALRSGNREALAEIGLDLDELSALGPRSQCARILDAVLGEGGHPDEMALRTAAAEQLKAIIAQSTPPSETDALRGFISAFVFQMAIVELRSDLASGTIDATAASKQEGRIRRYIARRVGQVVVTTGGTMTISEFSACADRLVLEALKLLRAR